MTTDYLHREMAEEIMQIGEEIGPQIDALMREAFDRAMQVADLGDERHHDALSLSFQLCAVMVAKATILLGDRYPLADPQRVWTTAMTDLQLRTQLAMQQMQEGRFRAGGAVQ
ncbi:putative protein OS=Sphingobium scionense OX=1404341 GN=GGQ90_002878 PE=4 SV=1 [Sphingobium scionense]